MPPLRITDPSALATSFQHYPPRLVQRSFYLEAHCVQRVSPVDIDSILSIILPYLPDARVGEDENGQLVIMTGVKARKEPAADPPSVLDSGWYFQPCISLHDYCVEPGLDAEEVLDVLSASGISFGTNDDTLVREERLCRLLGIEAPEVERYMISLGC